MVQFVAGLSNLPEALRTFAQDNGAVPVPYKLEVDYSNLDVGKQFAAASAPV